MIDHEKEAKSSETSLALTKALVLESAMMLIPGAAQAVGVVRSIYAHRFTTFVNGLAERLENVETDVERLASAIAETQALVLGTPVEDQERILNAVCHAVRIPFHSDHSFHSISITDSTGFRSLIPREFDQ